VRVSGQDFKDKFALAKDTVKEIEIPVRSANSVASILIEGDSTTRPRIETVTLVSAGGREMLLAPLEKEPVKTTVVQPVTGIETNPPPHVTKKTFASGKGVLDITVSPKTAIIMVDGVVITTRSIEVTPDENHKVLVEAPGYKVCLQYYRVRAGETRKIDILLEKMAKKTFFGL